jgi:release factor glutamine methyltransferase
MAGKGATIREALVSAGERLKGLPDSGLASEVLLAHCLGIGREKLFRDIDSPAEDAFIARFLELADRHAGGEPVAYLTGLKEFYGMEFFVDHRVLIPRPETEHLIDEVLIKAAQIGEGCRILDVGTGSGCIAVTVAKKCMGSRVTAGDISEDALEVARLNAVRHGVQDRIEFVRSDLMDGIDGPFDIIAANLPYIGKEKYNFISREAAEFEPDVALFGGSDGLELYRRLFAQIRDSSWKPRYLFGEFGFLQGDELRALLTIYFGGAKWEIKSDYASIERLFMVEFPPI